MYHITISFFYLQMLLMCSALIALAYSLPTDTQKNNPTTPENDTNILNAKENERPLVFIMEEKDPRSDSVVVQFVYTSNGGNSIVRTTGSEKDKYVIENPAQKERKNQKSNENDERKLIQVSSTEEPAQRYNNERKSDAFKAQISPLTSLVPEEISPLLAKWPKHFYDAFNPVKPFPELQIQKSNQINRKENDKRYIMNNGKEGKEIPYAAGPQLNPLSIYDRELYVPIFD